MTNPGHEAERQSAARELEKLRHDGDALGGVFTRWFPLRAADASDPVELWGTRIGRGLSLAAVIAGGLYLIWVFLR